jgi:dipeptidyl-peptidase-4
VDVHGGPGHQEVIAARAAWSDRQGWADAGFAVVVIDNRGTPGVAPSFEKVVHRRLADVILADQVDALHALADKHPDLDLSRVGIRGTGFGGWVTALAILRRPEVYHCGIATAPLVDWSLHTTAFTERYLGLPGDAGDLYGHTSLLDNAAEPVHIRNGARPLLLVGGADAHAQRLTEAMAAGNRPLWTIPAPDRPAELTFLAQHLHL